MNLLRPHWLILERLSKQEGVNRDCISLFSLSESTEIDPEVLDAYVEHLQSLGFVSFFIDVHCEMRVCLEPSGRAEAKNYIKNKTQRPQPSMSDVFVELDRPFRIANNEDLANWTRAIEMELDAGRQVLIRSVRQGSLVLLVNLPMKKAGRLIRLVNEHRNRRLEAIGAVRAYRPEPGNSSDTQATR
jgi:hypothetical protein